MTSKTARKLDNCARCGHGPDDHRIDDVGAAKRGEPIDPTNPATKFRCIGHNENGKWFDTDCDCADYLEPVPADQSGKL